MRGKEAQTCNWSWPLAECRGKCSLGGVTAVLFHGQCKLILSTTRLQLDHLQQDLVESQMNDF